METAVAAIDGIAACLFFAAAVVVWVNHRLAAPRTPIWARTTLAFLLFALDRGSNMVEWGLGESFAWMDSVQGYLAAAACLIMVWVALQFWALTRQVSTRREV